MNSALSTDLRPLMPQRPVPSLELALAGGGEFRLADETPRLMTMLVFYRGLHCQQCRDYIADLDVRLPEFEKIGIATLAISGDVRDRAERTRTEWSLQNIRIGYGLTPQKARDWGLFLTHGRPRAAGMQEPPWYSEPALYLVRPDQTLFFSSVQNMPFGRSRPEDVLAGFEFMFGRGYFIDKECPARGEVLTVDEISAPAKAP